MKKALLKLPLGIEEDVHNEFRMHTKLMLTELGKFQSKQDKDGAIRRTLQPISKTICAFLNTDGGRLFLGVNGDKMIKGITMSKNMIYHFFGSLRHMCEKFKPYNPMPLIKVSILEVVPIDDKDKVKLKKVDLDKMDSSDFPKLSNHSIGGFYCDCFNEINRAPAKQYLLIIQVSAPDANSPTVIFQNDEGLAYRRRLASNKCVYLDDLRIGEGIEQARMACGGHGYSMASYIPEIYGVAIGGCTYEGENMVMLLQLARYLVKSAALVKSGQSAKLGPLVAYLGVKSEPTSLIDRVPNAGFTEYVKTFRHIAKRQTLKAAEKFFGLLENGEKRDVAWNKSSVELNRASRLHTRLFIVEAFVRRVAEIADVTIKDALTDLLYLHVNYELLDVGTYALEDGFVSSTQLDYVRDQMYLYLAKIRPNAVSLVDSWEFTDIELRSVLGRRDGHVYENLFKWAKQSPLNKTDVLPSVETYLKPMMEKARQNSKL